MKNKLTILIIFILFVLAFTSCEKEFVPDVVSSEDEIVVEGYIEAGDLALPPFVILTRSIPFFSAFSQEQFNELFVREATITVTEGDNTYMLEELCLSDLDEDEREVVGNILLLFGASLDSLGDIDLCLYLNPDLDLRGEEGKSYELTIEAEGKTITSTTTIPFHTPIDSLFFVEPPGQTPDSLTDLRGVITDQIGIPDFYRYFTGVNRDPIIAPLNSVVNDKFFDGKTFEFPLPKAERRGVEIDEFYGLYVKGDTVNVKWTTIDEAHYDFWNTLEFNYFNQGPFSNYTRIQSNVDGALGIWGGYSVSYYRILAE